MTLIIHICSVLQKEDIMSDTILTAQAPAVRKRPAQIVEAGQEAIKFGFKSDKQLITFKKNVISMLDPVYRDDLFFKIIDTIGEDTTVSLLGSAIPDGLSVSIINNFDNLVFVLYIQQQIENGLSIDSAIELAQEIQNVIFEYSSSINRPEASPQRLDLRGLFASISYEAVKDIIDMYSASGVNTVIAKLAEATHDVEYITDDADDEDEDEEEEEDDVDDVGEFPYHDIIMKMSDDDTLGFAMYSYHEENCDIRKKYDAFKKKHPELRKKFLRAKFIMDVKLKLISSIERGIESNAIDDVKKFFDGYNPEKFDDMDTVLERYHRGPVPGIIPFSYALRKN
jgi:hypothetical protein